MTLGVPKMFIYLSNICLQQMFICLFITHPHEQKSTLASAGQENTTSKT